MSIELRAIQPEELGPYLDQLGRTFSGRAMRPELIERSRSFTELDRTLAGFESGRLVATAGVITMRMATVGEVLPTAGVTRVSVLPTHRRQGLLTSMMRRQLDEIRGAAEPIAVLYASEAPIYGRFGYGLASYQAHIRIASASAFRAEVDLRGRIRVLDNEEAKRIVPGLYERALPDRPGMITRPQSWWEARIDDAGGGPPEKSDPVVVVFDTGSGPEGYAIYRVKMEWGDDGPRSTAQLEDLIAVTPEAYAGLWRYCLDIDLMRQLECENRPLQEPLRHLLRDPRALTARFIDGLWLRLVDLDAALAGRRYLAPGRLVLDVRDSFCEWNQGVHSLAAGPDGQSCEPGGGQPDLRLDTADLAACYLGANSFRDLAWAGRVDEVRPGAAALADAMFASPITPWCPLGF